MILPLPRKEACDGFAGAVVVETLINILAFGLSSFARLYTLTAHLVLNL